MGLFSFLIPSGETKETQGLETWVVEWRHMEGWSSNYPDIKPSYQAFTDYEKAAEFKKRLQEAHKLLGNSINNKVEIKKQAPGL